MSEVWYTVLGSVIGIVVTWVFNLVTSKMQHKMEIRRIALQNKLDTSKTAISWLMDVRGKLQTTIWLIEHRDTLNTSTIEYANRKTIGSARA